MMNKIKILKLKKIYKEFEYLQSDYEYRQELISEIDVEFMKSVTEFLLKFPELKDLYEKKIQERLDELLEQIQKRQTVVEEEQIEPNTTTDLMNSDFESSDEVEPIIIDDVVASKLKILYRSIAKLTHPDKVLDTKLNDLYVLATKYYNENDIHNIYRICDQLNITYDIDDGDIAELEVKIESLKQKVNFTEGTYTWKWYHSTSEDIKNSLILEYVSRQI